MHRRTHHTRILALTLALTLIIGSLPAAAFARTPRDSTPTKAQVEALAAAVARISSSSVLAFTVPVASSFSTTVAANRQNSIQLQGSDAEGTALTYATTSTPAHGTLSGLNASTGVVIYTPVMDYVGADSFTYTVTSGGETSTAGTVTLTVTNQKTRIIDTVVDASGAPRSGKVTFILTQPVTSPTGLTPKGASVSASLNGAGKFDISVYPSRALQPAAYYQVYWYGGAGQSELLGIYSIPLSTATINLAPYKILDTNLAAQYTFASEAAVSSLSTQVSAAAFASLDSADVTDALGYTPMNPANNLGGLGSTATARTNLGLGTAATHPVGDFLQSALNLSDVTASAARTNLGLGTMATQAASGINVTGGTLANITCTNCTNVGSATNGAFAASGDEVINFDSNADGSGAFHLQRGGVNKFSLSNVGALTTSLSSAHFATSGGQFFEQIDQVGGASFPATVGFLNEMTSTSAGAGEFAFVSRIYDNPAGKVGGSAYTVGGLFEARTTGSVATTAEIIGLNSVADCNAQHGGQCRSFEPDINFAGTSTAAYMNPAVTPGFATAVLIASGGLGQPHAGIYMASPRPQGKFRRGIIINSNAYTEAAIELGGDTGVNTSAGFRGELAIKQINTRAAFLGESSGGTGDMIRFLTHGATGTTFRVDVSGTVQNIGSGGYQLLNNSLGDASVRGFTMSLGSAITPNYAAGNKNLVILAQTGTSTFSEQFTIYHPDNANAISLGGACLVGWGTGAPAFAWPDCSTYHRTDGGQFYVRQGGVWTVK